MFNIQLFWNPPSRFRRLFIVTPSCRRSTIEANIAKNKLADSEPSRTHSAHHGLEFARGMRMEKVPKIFSQIVVVFHGDFHPMVESKKKTFNKSKRPSPKRPVTNLILKETCIWSLHHMIKAFKVDPGGNKNTGIFPWIFHIALPERCGYSTEFYW